MLVHVFLLVPHIVVLLELSESRGTCPYASLSMMTTRDTMTAGTPGTGMKQGTDPFTLTFNSNPDFVDFGDSTHPIPPHLV